MFGWWENGRKQGDFLRYMTLLGALVYRKWKKKNSQLSRIVGCPLLIGPGVDA